MLNNTREIAYTVLLDIEKNNTFSNIALSKALRINQFAEKKDRAFVTRLVEGVTELKIRLDYVINDYSKSKVNKLKPPIRVILRMGVYQLLYMNSVPDSAAINESVNLAKRHGFKTLAGFVNGVLRTIGRNKDICLLKLPNPAAEYSVPDWLYDFLHETYGEDAEKILSAQFLERGTTIRCNSTKITRDELMEKLLSAGISVEKSAYDENALIIYDYDFIRKVPGYKKGEFSVQDVSSMCAVSAAGIAPGSLVLDMCAAPGGKSLYAAEILIREGMKEGFKGASGRVISRDISKEKTDLIRENAERLGLDNIIVEEYDALSIDKDMIEKADTVIADVPCSGLGVIGKKNDIKYRISREDMTNLSIKALEILNNAAMYVKPGGTLLFSTCTINPEENNINCEKFLKTHPEFIKGEEKTFIQGIDDCDGFYYCIMKKRI